MKPPCFSRGRKGKLSALSCLFCFILPDETKLPVARVVVYDTILLLNISIDMPSSQNRSNCTFRYGFLRLATIPTAKSGLKELEFIAVLLQLANGTCMIRV
ncbi:MAG: hypothetical protein GQ554_06280, partial [Deltaproteobacteria bacterium]|nr:hypothetical protein [Deltaproteobacteria bacterium]